MATKPFAWVAIAAIAVAIACAPNRTSTRLPLADDGSPIVTVRNDNLLDVAVYLVRGATRFRLGTVRSTSSETFRLTHDGLVSPVRIMANPIGENRRYVTDAVVLSPGQRLEVTVGSPIWISSFAIRNR